MTAKLSGRCDDCGQAAELVPCDRVDAARRVTPSSWSAVTPAPAWRGRASPTTAARYPQSPS